VEFPHSSTASIEPRGLRHHTTMSTRVPRRSRATRDLAPTRIFQHQTRKRLSLARESRTHSTLVNRRIALVDVRTRRGRTLVARAGVEGRVTAAAVVDFAAGHRLAGERQRDKAEVRELDDGLLRRQPADGQRLSRRIRFIVVWLETVRCPAPTTSRRASCEFGSTALRTGMASGPPPRPTAGAPGNGCRHNRW
jgi:hypothetical protein